MTVGRERAVCAAFVGLADTLVADRDTLSQLHHLSEFWFSCWVRARWDCCSRTIR
jgi:hypothetical protein